MKFVTKTADRDTGMKSADTVTLSQGEADHSATNSDNDTVAKRKYDTISDQDRLKLILLIKDFGMSCHKASKVLNIAYNNAKVIFRIFKKENRIRQTPKQLKRHAKTIRADNLRQRQLDREARVNALMDDEASEHDIDEEAYDNYLEQVTLPSDQSSSLENENRQGESSYRSNTCCK